MRFLTLLALCIIPTLLYGEGPAPRTEIHSNARITALEGRVAELEKTIEQLRSRNVTAVPPGVSEANIEQKITQAELTEALSSTPTLLVQCRAVPYFRDGQAVGLRFVALKTGSIYEKIGLKNGDIVRSIDNSPIVSDLSQFLVLFTKLDKVKKSDVVVERQTRVFTLQLKVV